jgi:hypothetical protein
MANAGDSGRVRTARVNTQICRKHRIVAKTSEEGMEVLVIAALIGLVPAAIAKNKGRSFVLWWLFGAALFIVALPVALLIKPDAEAIERQQLVDGMKKCPYCAEFIKNEASVCKHCARELGTT